MSTPVKPDAEEAAPKVLHPDSQYIMQENIGPVIAKGLA